MAAVIATRDESPVAKPHAPAAARRVLRRGVRRSQGRGSFETAPRTARAVTDRPISASSAAAWTAVPTMSVPRAGTGLRREGRLGVPGGCAGWRRRGTPARGVVAERFGAALGPAVGLAVVPRLVAAARAVPVRLGVCATDGSGVGAADGSGGWAADGSGGWATNGSDDAFTVCAAGGSAAAFASGRRTPRLSLRRCGRVRGSAPRTSEGWSSLIPAAIIAHETGECSTLLG